MVQHYTNYKLEHTTMKQNYSERKGGGGGVVVCGIIRMALSDMYEHICQNHTQWKYNNKTFKKSTI